MSLSLGDAIDTLFNAYAKTMLWANTDDDDEPLDYNYTLLDVGLDTFERMRRDCKDFLARSAKYIPGDRLEDAGHDFLLTRDGHGAGFWDGDWPEHGDKLTEIAHSFGPFEIYIGDDGLIHAMGV